jgi:hypothetical protein
MKINIIEEPRKSRNSSAEGKINKIVEKTSLLKKRVVKKPKDKVVRNI